jgi:hypothetical protein
MYNNIINYREELLCLFQTKTNIEVSKEQELELKSRFGDAIRFSVKAKAG